MSIRWETFPLDHVNTQGAASRQDCRQAERLGTWEGFFGGVDVSFQGNALKSYAFDNVVTLMSNLVVCDLGEA